MIKMVPYLFLGLLLLVLVFVLGVRYGKNVEQTNKVITYFLTATPPQAKATATPSPLEFETIESEDCGASFLLPKEVVPSGPQTLEYKIRGSISCAEITPLPANPSNKTATAEATIANKKHVIREKADNTNYYIFQTRHPKTNKLIEVVFQKNYLPLISTSFKFL